MRILPPCSEIVESILGYWSDIATFIENNVSTWRKLKADNIIDIGQKLGDEFYERFKNSQEAIVTKGKYFYTWGAIGIRAEGRPTFYFPYTLIELAAFNTSFDDIMAEITSGDLYVDLLTFIDAIIRIVRRLSINFKTREIEALKVIVMSTLEREGSKIGIRSFTELAQHLNLSLAQARNYWTNLDKFFARGIHIDYGKIGLKPVLVKHIRPLTSLEKQYTKYSFFDHDCYYSLLFIPRESSWVETNEIQDCDFISLGDINRMDFEWNLKNLTEIAETRWGSYPGLQRKHLKKKPACTIYYDHFTDSKGFHIKDFLILNSLSTTIDKSKDAAKDLGISTSYYSQRVSFLLDNYICIPRIDLHNVGLDLEMFLVLHERNNTGSEMKTIIERVNNCLLHFPNAETYWGDNSLLAKISIPSRMMAQYLLEVQNLSEPGGHWYDSEITAITHNSRTRSSIKNGLTNLQDLIIPRKTGYERGKLNIDWSFEIPVESR
ncbi:MAG: hypothetical protein ACXAEU_13760 [Candidatus Hodarchaeales archaeon]|jgi:hypothetical protein